MNGRKDKAEEGMERTDGKLVEMKEGKGTGLEQSRMAG